MKFQFLCIAFCIFFNFDKQLSEPKMSLSSNILILEFYCRVRNSLTSSILNNKTYKDRHFRFHFTVTTFSTSAILIFWTSGRTLSFDSRNFYNSDFLYGCGELDKLDYKLTWLKLYRSHAVKRNAEIRQA